MSTDSFRIVHISDLHFVANAFERGSRFRARSLLAKSHSVDKASLLAERLLQLEYIDVLAVTGDLTTDGSDGALQTVRAYLEQPRIAGTATRRQTYPITALGTVARTTVAVPGNHDRFGGRKLPTQHDCFGFDNVFGQDAEYPRVVYGGEYRRRPVIFLLMNSVPMPDLVTHFAAWRRPMRVAGGYVPSRASASLRRLARNLPPESIKIAVLHHHPIRRPRERQAGVRGLMKRAVPIDRLKEMNGSEDFVAACHDSGIRLVLFGHKHVAFNEAQVGSAKPVHFLCCASTLQYKTKHPRGFYDILIAHDRITVTPYEDTGGSYEPQPPLEHIPL
jgi:3',5'-cyclic AMP phosphodiesterase CpdA